VQRRQRCRGYTGVEPPVGNGTSSVVPMKVLEDVDAVEDTARPEVDAGRRTPDSAACLRTESRARCQWAGVAFLIMVTDPHMALQALCGDLPADPEKDRAADRAVQVLHAHAAALAWVRQATGTYPALPAVAAHLAEIAAQLRDDDRDPLTTLIAAAATAVTQHRATTTA